MRLDMTNTFNEAKENINIWKKRYASEEYPFKVVLNIFYRQFTMNSIWEKELKSSFVKYFNTEPDWVSGYEKIENEYSQASGQFTVGNTLVNLMNQRQIVGGINYANFEQLISRGKIGNKSAIEEIEFSYIYYYLTNKAINIWASFGRTGQNEIDSIATITGAIVEANQEITYSVITNTIGQIGVAKAMNDLY